MLKVTVLLDVDETCAISNKFYGQQDGGYRYNDALFTALKDCGCTEVYLFTSFNLGSVTSDEAVGTPSRLKLIRHLENQGFKVQGVVTPLDVAFKKGAGAYYEEIIKPFESRVLAGEDIRRGAGAPIYQAAVQAEMKLVKETSELSVGDKGSLYQYFIDSQREALLYPHFNVVFVDDRPVCLSDIKNANQKYHYPLRLVLAKPQDTVAYYQKLLSDFQYSLGREQITQQLAGIKILTLDKTQTEAYQVLQKEFASISSQADLLALRHFSVKVAYFLSGLEKQATILSIPSVLADNPLLEDRVADRLVACLKAMPGMIEVSDSVQPEALLYGLDKPYGLSLETARKILYKINTTGNSRVGRVNNVFFKQGAEYSLIEQAVYQLSRLFGEELVAPTRLLLLKIPHEDIYALQASLGMGVDFGCDAIGLDELCQISEVIAALKEDLGETQFFRDFSVLLTNDYYKTWLNKCGFSLDISFEGQCIILVESLLKLPEERWPVGLKELYSQPESQKTKLLHNALNEAFQDKKAPLRILALLDFYPALSKHHLNHLIICVNAFECLRFLYPSLDAKVVLKEAGCLLSYIDKTNLSAHLLLEMVSEPQDHKGDNFKVQFKRDSQGNLIAPLEIVAIDNDAAMEHVFKSKAKEHLILVKSLLFANRTLLNEPIAESVRDRCLAINPKIAIMQWLEALNHYYAPYYALKDSGIIFKGLSDTLRLEKQVSVDFIKRLSERLEVIQDQLKEGVVTHRKLLCQVEPLLGYSYQSLGQRYPSSQELMTVLYNKKKPMLLGNFLTKDLDQMLGNEKTLEALMEVLPAAKDGGHCSYIETLTRQVSDSLTAGNPLQFYALTLCMRSKFYHITLPPEGLVLTATTFIKAYIQAPQKWIHLIKSCPKVSIQFQIPLLLNNPLILYYAISQAEGPLLVEALLACGVSVNQRRLEDGLTPLHFAACFYPDCIPALIAGGAQIEQVDASGMTPLEMALSFNQHKAVILLLQLGAGRNLKVSIGLNFIKAYQKLCPELCQSLLSRNIAMNWYLALETASQEAESSEGVSIMGIRGKRYLRSEIYQDIFKKGHVFPKDNIHGVRSVTSIQCKIAEGISVGLHLKQYPELPGREIMVHILAKQLFGLITPSTALWRFSKTTKFLKKEVAYPVLASRSIEGKNLFDMLEENPEHLKKLDKSSAYEAIVLAMMINPEDGRADNYIMQPFSKGRETSYRLISIDNDHAFVRPIGLKKSGAELTGTKALQVKTILYCLEEMRDALPQEMVTKLLACNPYDLLRNWLIELQQQQKQIDGLFTEKEKKELLKTQDIHLDILFKFSVVEDIYQKFCCLQSALKENPKISLLGLLRMVIPELWIRYAEAFSQHPTPLARFNALTKDSFEMRIVKIEGKNHLYPGSTAKASEVLQMTQTLREEEKEWQEEQEASSETALLRLDKLYAECSAIDAIAKELQEGLVKRFEKLPSLYQEKIVNGEGRLPGLDFNAMLIGGRIDTKRQKTVLSALYGISFRVLKIRNFSALTDNHVWTHLDLQELFIVSAENNCIHVSDL